MPAIGQGDSVSGYVFWKAQLLLLISVVPVMENLFLRNTFHDPAMQ